MRFLVLLAFLSTAQAQTIKSPHVEAELLSEFDRVQDGSPFFLALRLKMDPHWHTYWLFPGDSGLTTKVKWNGQAEFSSIYWPTPRKILLPPLVNYGYDDEIFLLTKVVPNKGLAKLDIKAKVSWLACKEECIPGGGEFTLSIPIGKNSVPSQSHDAIKTIFSQLPQNLNGENISVEPKEKELVFQISNKTKWLPENANLEFFPAADQITKGFSSPKVIIGDNIEVRIEKASPFQKNLTSISGLFLVNPKSGPPVGYWIEQKLISSIPIQEFSWNILVLAFLGGLILNLMPCVFPVLSIKILGILNQSKEVKGRALQHGLFYAAGVLLSFWLLAGILIFLRSKGEDLGWGFQLQSPNFVVFMIFLLFTVAMNFLGIFELSGRFMGAGSSLASRDGPIGDFATGILAVLVATPCAAPFMGTAIGVALTQPTYIAFFIFTSLACGLALPYLLLALFPAALGFLPRPGNWMVIFKEALAFPILATIVWLIWVFIEQCGELAAMFVISALILLAMAFWARMRIEGIAKNFLVASLTIIALYLGFFQSKFVSATPNMEQKDGDWKPFSEALLDEALKAKKPVFIDFTAAWCLSCKVNETLVLSKTSVLEKFQNMGVLKLKGDWTSRNPVISKALEGYGRLGVPLYVVYNRNSEPIFLPQILTESMVLEAFTTKEK